MMRFLRFLILLSGFILLWQIIVMYFKLPDYILPAPYQVLTIFYQQKWLLLKHTWPTFLETSLGFLFGIVLGALAGLVISFSSLLRKWCLPLLIMSQALPTFVIAPLFVIWLGYGLTSKIVITMLMIFFPVMSALHDGLNKTPEAWLNLAKTMNASPLRVFMRIRLPAALPSFATGIKLAAVIAPVGAIVSEWVGSSQGLGYLMLNANARLQIADMFAALMIIIAMSLLLYFSVDRLLKKLIWWDIK